MSVKKWSRAHRAHYQRTIRKRKAGRPRTQSEPALVYKFGSGKPTRIVTIEVYVRTQ